MRAYVALPKIGFNEGSLLRRTMIHVGTFVVGSAAFVGVTSFVLVSIAKGFVAPPHAEAAEEDVPALAASAASGKPPAPFLRPGASHVPAKRHSLPAVGGTRTD